jgi:hypothetical protein
LGNHGGFEQRQRRRRARKVHLEEGGRRTSEAPQTTTTARSEAFVYESRLSKRLDPFTRGNKKKNNRALGRTCAQTSTRPRMRSRGLLGARGGAPLKLGPTETPYTAPICSRSVSRKR